MSVLELEVISRTIKVKAKLPVGCTVTIDGRRYFVEECVTEQLFDLEQNPVARADVSTLVSYDDARLVL